MHLRSNPQTSRQALFKVLVATTVLNVSILAPSRSVAQPSNRGATSLNPRGSAGADHHAKAKGFFANGKYERAIQYAAADLRRRPHATESILILAMSYYRLGRTSRAVAFFNRIPARKIPPAASVDYALAMFALKNYAAVARVWQKVPDAHPYRDVVRFYAAISYKALGQNENAERLLRISRNLPQSLRSERRRIMGELASRQSGPSMSYAPPSSPVPVFRPPEPPPPPISSAPSLPSSTEKKQPPPAPQVGFTASATPTVSYALLSRTLEYNGYNTVNMSRRTSELAVPLGLKYSGAPRSFGGQPTLGITTTPSYLDRDSDGQTSQYTAPEDDPTSIRGQVTTTESSERSASLISKVDASYPLSDSFDFAAAYSDSRSYPNLKSQLERRSSGPDTKLTLEIESIRLDLKYSYLSYENQRIEPAAYASVSTVGGALAYNGETSTTTLDASYATTDSVLKKGEQSGIAANLAWKKSWDNVTGTLGGGMVTKTVYDATVISSAPDVTNEGREQKKLNLKLNWSPGFGLSLTGAFDYITFTNFESIVKDEADQDLILSSPGTSKNLTLSANLSIGDHVALESSYLSFQRDIGVSEAAYQETILTKEWSYYSDAVFKLILKATF